MAETYFGLSDKGKVRDNNEDAFIAEKFSTGSLLACVIDGVGGYEGGEVAAEIARSTILKKLQTATADVLQSMRDAVQEANRNIYNEKLSGKGNSQMACVLTMALIDTTANTFFYAHVGDTRLYLLRDGSLVKVTKDQSFVGFLEDGGRLSEAEAMAHPKRHEINKALGFDPHIDAQDDYIETGSSPFLPGDLLMLCSDGLTDLVTAKEMTAILVAASSLQQKAARLIDAANGVGGKDNITVVLVKNDKKPQKQKATKPVLIKKEPIKIDGAAASITSEAATPKLIEPQSIMRKKSDSLLWVFVVLSVLLALTAFWLWTKNKDLQAAMPKPVIPVPITAAEKQVQDAVGIVSRELILSPAVLSDTVRLTDTLIIRQDSLRIDGKGIVFVADSTFGGPALFIAGSCKRILLENVVFKNFHTAIITESKGLELENVFFENNTVSVQKNFDFNHSASGKFIDSFFIKRSLPR